MSSSEKIKSMLVLEIIGRPPEHLTETLKNITEQMGKEKGVAVKSKEIKEPTPLKDSKDFYTTFAEIEVETDDVLYLTMLIFKYMPAHIEIIEPENIALTNNGFGEILNEIVRRLHAYDEVARIMQIERQKLFEKMKELEGKGKSKAEKEPKSKGKAKKN